MSVGVDPTAVSFNHRLQHGADSIRNYGHCSFSLLKFKQTYLKKRQSLKKDCRFKNIFPSGPTSGSTDSDSEVRGEKFHLHNHPGGLNTQLTRHHTPVMH